MEPRVTQSLAGRTALVTGASRGIGRSTAERLARDGARVVVSARSEAALIELCASLPAVPSGAHVAVPMDVSDAESIAAALCSIEERVGHVDLLVSNAGIAESMPFHRTEDAVFERLLNVNMLATVRLARKLVPKMIAAGFGRVVLVASNAGLAGYAYTSAYCASKHALIGWMRAVALELATTKVTLNAVCPGWVDTDMARDAANRIAQKTGCSVEQALVTLTAMSPENRMSTPEEVADAIADLCVDEAASVHGQALVIDGGKLVR
ncbi:MAG: SDR family oxidoreductase [Myxococcales bacterium]|nr:SDR family oxidoreductase [Myxococcales bacterium]